MDALETNDAGLSSPVTVLRFRVIPADGLRGRAESPMTEAEIRQLSAPKSESDPKVRTETQAAYPSARAGSVIPELDVLTS